MFSKMAISQYDATIQPLVDRAKETMMLVRALDNPSSIITPSAYDTAWVAMVGDPNTKCSEEPLFRCCLDWILNNQRPNGSWGEEDCHGNPTIDSFPATLACMVALKRWSLGHEHINRGMAFIKVNSRKLLKLKQNHNKFPRWFVIVFAGMVELARRTELQVVFDDEVEDVVDYIFRQRQEILNTEELKDKHSDPCLLSCLEVLPTYYDIDDATIRSNLSGYGSLFRSPSATAAVFMTTQNTQALSYLCHLVQHSNGGVPTVYPVDEHYINLCMINQLQRLGLSKQFDDQISVMLEQIHREYDVQESSIPGCLTPANLYKSSLAFQLLRLQGYHISPRMSWAEIICWFLNDKVALKHIEENYEKFESAIYNLYRATHLRFDSEVELQKLRSFSRRLLANSSLCHNIDDGIMLWPHLQETIKREIANPWLARMDHLEHREWIEANEENTLWLGKSSYFRISCLVDEDLLQLAMSNYELRQMVYQKELEELIRWSKISGLTDMGFAREKATYCYFAIASATSLPYDSDVRLIVAKSAILITIFDDYFDMEGSLDDLHILTNAVQRWNNEGLKSHGKVLFDELDNFVSELAEKYIDRNGIDITDHIRKLWYEVIASWLKEAKWSKTGEIPSMESYMETGMVSIAVHLIILQASCFLTPSLSLHNLNPCQYDDITKLLMVSCRLLNDLQSYEKEIKDGKINSIFLYMKENPGAKLEDAICYIESVLEKSKMKLLEHALMDGKNDNEMPKPLKTLHLEALKVFQMFFNSANVFDSKDTLLHDINKAIFLPFVHKNTSKLSKSQNPNSHPNTTLSVNNCIAKMSLQCYGMRSKNWTIRGVHVPIAAPFGSHRVRMKMKVPSALKLLFAD